MPKPVRVDLRRTLDEYWQDRAELAEAAVETLRTALIESNLTSKTRAEQTRIAQDALNQTWDVPKGDEAK